MDILDILLDILLKPPQPFIGLFLLKNLQIRVFSLIYGYKRKQLKEYIPPHVHMHSSDPYCRI